jgi:hypothetical protein
LRCILHIGTEKTGTKTVQRFLLENRRGLARRGTMVPAATRLGNAIGLPVMAYEPDRADDLTRQLLISTKAELLHFQGHLMAILSQELRMHKPRTVIFSSEHLQSRLTEQREIVRLRDGLLSMGFDEFTIVIYLRRPADLANSLFSTALRAAHDMRDLPTPDHGYVRVLCDHRATIVRWSAVFGQAAVRPRLFVPAAFVNRSLVDDFAAVAALDMEGLSRPAAVNVSLSAPAADLLRRVNGIVAERSPLAPVPPVDDIVEAVDGVVGRQEAYSMPSWLRESYDAAFAESDEWVRRNFFSTQNTLWPVRPANDRAAVVSDGIGFDHAAARVAELCIRCGWCRPRVEGKPSGRVPVWQRGIGRLRRAWRRHMLRRLLREEVKASRAAAGNAAGRGSHEEW